MTKILVVDDESDLKILVKQKFRKKIRDLEYDYAVIDDVVNTAQRLQSSAEPGQVVISEKSYQKVKEFFKCEKVGEMTFKNKAEAMLIYEVVE